MEDWKSIWFLIAFLVGEKAVVAVVVDVAVAVVELVVVCGVVVALPLDFDF